MSTQVEQRVVSMQFDNQRFERNASDTLRTLDKLKQSLRFENTANGLENVNRAINSTRSDVGGLSTGLETVQAKFSALQVVGVTALANLTNSAVNAAKKISGIMTNALVQGGINRAMNIEQAKFQLEGLGYAWSDIEGDIDYAVKGTAYGLDAAAKAASQLVASNVKIGDSMKTALRGISGVAAMTNSSYEDISRIFTTVAGNGRLMGEQLLSISSRGINAAAALGKYLGKTEAQVRDLVSKGRIDFATFAAAMDSAFGEHAKDANKTFTGALSNMKAALSRIGADVAMVGLDNLRDILNGLRVSFDDLRVSLKPFIETINKLQTSVSKFIVKFIDLGGLKNIFSSFGNIFKGLWSVIKPIKDAFTDIFPPSTAEYLVEITKKISELTSKFKLTDEQTKKLKTGFKGLFSILEVFVDATKVLASKVWSLLGNFKGLITILFDVIESLGKFLLKVRDSIDETNIFTRTIEALGGFIQKVIDKLKEFKSYLSKKFDLEGLEGFSGVLQGIWNIIKKLGGKLVEFGKMIAGNLSDDNVQNALGLAGAILLLRNAWINWYIGIGAPLKRMISIIKNLFAGVKDFLDLGSSIKGTFQALNSSLWNLNRTLKYELLMNYAKALAILAAAILVLSLVDTDRLAASLGVVTVLIGEMVGVVAILNKMTTVSLGGKGIKGFFTGLTDSIMGIAKTSNMTTTMIKMAAALLILAIALKNIAKLDIQALGRGLLGVIVLMSTLVIATKKMTTDSKDVVKGAGQMLVMALALTVLTGALKIIASMSWTGLAKGVVGLLGITIILVTAAKQMQSEYKSITKFAGQMLIMAVSLTVLAGVLTRIAAMSWVDLGKGLAGIAATLLVMIVALKSMSSMEGRLFGSAASILVMSVAMNILAGTMKTMGSMSWESIAKSLVVMAGALIIFGVAAYALMASGATLALLALCGAMALFGVGVLAVGVGLVAAAAGITALAAAFSAGATAIVAGLNILILGFIDLIPAIVVALCDGLKILIRTLIDVIVTSIPDIVEGIGKLIVGVLELLVSYTPKIVELIYDFFIHVLDTIAKKIPELTQSFVNLLMVLFTSVADALKNVDTKVLLDGILAVGLISGIIVALAAVAVLTPLAMVGVLGMAAVVTELAFVLAAIGGLAQIPGLEWMISSGGYLLQAIGTAIGQFIGGIVGGFAQGVTSSLPQIGNDLSSFMRNIADFIEGAKQIKPSMLSGVAALAGVITILTAANLVDRLTSWFTGKSSLTRFGEELAEFGPYMKDYADSVSDVEPAAIVASANAAKALSELANNLPKAGGLVAWFSGENSLANFGVQLVPFGLGMKAYSTAISGMDHEAVINSATAAKALCELANNLPNRGGIASWFTGENDIASWGIQLIPFGLGMKAYSKAIEGIDSGAITNSAIAAKALVELANELPNTGGLVSYFTGDNSIAGFGAQLVPFGLGMKAYSKAIEGINPEAITASATAGKSLSELANSLPNTGGLVALFTGDNSIAGFGAQLVPFGLGMKAYSDSIADIDTNAVVGSANAAKALSELAANLPNTGGLVSYFTGDNSIAGFGAQLVPFGLGMKAYSDSIANIDAESIVASANAAKILSDLAATLPDTGGLVSLFTGDNSLSSFGYQLVPFGLGMKAYSKAIEGINPEAITASATAAQALAEVCSILSSEESSLLSVIENIFTDDDRLKTMGEQLTPLGEGIKAYSDAITAGNGIDAEAVSVSANAAKTLAEMVSILPKDTGKIIGFGENLAAFSDDLKTYFNSVSEISNESISKVTNITNAIADLSKAATSDGSNLKRFGKNMKSLANELSDFITKIKKVSASNIDDAINKVKKLIALSDTIASTGSDAVKSFAESLKKLATEGINGFVKSLNSGSAKTNAKSALVDLISSCTKAVRTVDNKLKFESLGKYLIEGIAKGIRDNKPTATKAAQEVADAVEAIIRSAWLINSPSKLFYKIALGVGEGIKYAFADSTRGVESSASDLASTATSGFGNAIQKIAEFVNSDMDTQPTIRPVLDLTDVQAGANSIAGMFSGNRTLAISAPGVGAISASMTNRQNGNNDLTSAINKLAKSNGKSGDIYNFNGFTYSEGSDVADAIQTLVRAAKIEGRT